MLKIGNITLKNNLLLAPMAGYSDAGFRALALRYGAALAFTEMVSAKGLVLSKNSAAGLLYTTDAESVKAVQLFGREPEFFAKALALPELDKFDIIDINMGCPVLKINKNFEGAALMDTPSLAGQIVSAAVNAAGGRPVTVKMWLGASAFTAPAVAKAAEDAGAAAVTVHGRFKRDMYAGAADLEKIAEVKSAVKIPVIANGDIADKSSLEKALKVTAADGFMIGRGALGKPYIFAELNDYSYHFDVKADIFAHIEILKCVYPERVVANVMKKHLCFCAKNVGAAKAVRLALSEVKDFPDLLELVERFF
ncbi:MAG TPA: tRNA-dihydrouridine synthase [Eubacteriales bacterium]|nr:tRNA-dihydrouridine synthase [Eubacteriales bacterium]